MYYDRSVDTPHHISRFFNVVKDKNSNMIMNANILSEYWKGVFINRIMSSLSFALIDILLSLLFSFTILSSLEILIFENAKCQKGEL